MRTEAARPVRLADYRLPDYLIDTVELDVRLDPAQSRVRALLHIRANPKGRAGAPLVLDGDGLNAVSARLDGKLLDLSAIATPDQLTIAAPPSAPFTLAIETIVDPTGNTHLSGLYRSGGTYCTQCEAEGFRRITYFIDRPDVLSVYTTRIEAEKSEAPLLLGNGNPAEAGDIAGTTRHYAVWRDPHPKPCYLFALVGGDLGAIRDVFTTMSGRKVDLAIYVEHGKESQAHYAMDSLKRAMAWDETTFGREYDLDLFNIVAVSSFNMGAMENKGLNIFNDKYILASPQTATDSDYAHIEAVVAHEYFHNWTGNRITCRDWFQLCLKEGLTVFRDREFSADQRSRPVKRISDVRALRGTQFQEDSGPLAHNVRPTVYHEINNFYTSTIYEKGAEVIRMLRTLIGAEAFRRGMDLYFARCDGTAAVVEEFIACFAEASGRDLGDFMLWYNQAGAPLVKASGKWDAQARTYTLDLEQSCPPTPGQPDKKPLVIPVALGLIGAHGKDIKLQTQPANHPGGAQAAEISRGVFELTGKSRRLVFENIAERPAASLFRGFSAPVRVDFDAPESDLLTLLAHDSDMFNRWQAGQTLATRLLMRSVAAVRSGGAPLTDETFAHGLGQLIDRHDDDNAFAAQALTLPSESDIAREIGADVDPDAIHTASLALRSAIGKQLESKILAAYASLSRATSEFTTDAKSAGRRAMRNALLDLHAAGNPGAGATLALEQFTNANNMPDRMGALSTLVQIKGEGRDKALADFYRQFSGDALVVDKWFAMQALFPDAEALPRVRALMKHDLFSMTNPNRLRALIGTFSVNPTQFNAAGGEGYELLARVVSELDSVNPQVAARLLFAFRTWRNLESGRRARAETALRSIAAKSSLSADVRDIVERSLA